MLCPRFNEDISMTIYRKLGEFTEQYISAKAKEDYEVGVADFKIDARKSVLLVVDYLDEFVKPNWSPYWIPEATRQLPKIKKLIETSRQLSVPVIFTAYRFHPRGVDLPPIIMSLPEGRKAKGYVGQLFVKESIYREVGPEPGDIVMVKHTYSAFYGTTLDTILKNLHADTVIVCGTMTNFCCGATAREAYWRGYKVVFGSDVNSTDDEQIQEAELKTLRRGYAMVISSDEIIRALRGDGAFASKSEASNE